MKPSVAKAKGRATENQLVEWLRGQGYTAERRRLNGSKDLGDISVHGLPLVIEVKSGARAWPIPEWTRQTSAEMKNAGVKAGLLAIRPPRGTNVNRWIGITFDWVGPEYVELPPSMPWNQIHQLIMVNPTRTFTRNLSKPITRLTVGYLPLVFRIAAEGAEW